MQAADDDRGGSPQVPRAGGRRQEGEEGEEEVAFASVRRRGYGEAKE